MQKIGFRKKGNSPALGCAEMLGSCGSCCTNGKSLRAIETVNCSVEYVKKKAIKKIDRFIGNFKEWEAKNKPITSPPKPKKTKPEKKAQPPAQWLVELEEQLSNYDHELVNEVLKEKGYNSIYDIPNEEEATGVYLSIDARAKIEEELKKQLF